jgi:uncharacterized protein (DUF1015 family)
MAKIQPFRAWRYNPGLKDSIETLTSPLFDVVSEKQLKHLYRNKINSIHLSVPLGDDPAKNAKNILESWKSEGIIEQDPLPGIYVYYQYFKLPGEEKQQCRKGFICNIKIQKWDDNIILRHENTSPKAVNDRIELLKETELNVSATHGFFTNEERELEPYMDESIEHPIYDTEDYQGVRDVMSVIHDAKVILKFIEVIKEKQVILADGHHRYEGSLIYRNKMMKQNSSHSGEEGYNYHLMYLTNTESYDFRILPTHRLISGLKDISEFKILKNLETYFDVRNCENFYDINTFLLGKTKTFGIIFKENSYIVQLKSGIRETNPWPFPEIIKHLDITIMHYFIIEKVLGIEGKDQRSSEFISYDRSFADCYAKILTGAAQMAIIANEITMKQVKEVCYSGFTMPPKTTFFYPKVICGFLFSSMQEDEFALPFDFSLE